MGCALSECSRYSRHLPSLLGDQRAREPSSGSDRNALRFTLPRLNGEPGDLSKYKGSVVLVVNTATECGFTPQFEGLEALWRDRRDDGLVVLGFPANDFAGQEPRSDREIGEFCRANYGVTFPMFSKLVVTGGDAHPLFRALGEPDWTSTSTCWIAAAGWWSAGGPAPSPTTRRSPASSRRC